MSTSDIIDQYMTIVDLRLIDIVVSTIYSSVLFNIRHCLTMQLWTDRYERTTIASGLIIADTRLFAFFIFLSLSLVLFNNAERTMKNI
jgi:hypothetical protein